MLRQLMPLLQLQRTKQLLPLLLLRLLQQVLLWSSSPPLMHHLCPCQQLLTGPRRAEH
jgi:hypothetical protein